MAGVGSNGGDRVVLKERPVASIKQDVFKKRDKRKEKEREKRRCLGASHEIISLKDLEDG